MKEEGIEMATNDNLKAAFAGESQANRRYLAFAKQAQQDGRPQIAKLFRAVAEAETIHAHAHLRVLGEVKSTADNLKAAIDGESYEFTKMYPEFLQAAKAEGNKAAATSFERALAVERIHHALYEQALQAAGAGGDAPSAKLYVCGVCGNTVLGEPPDVCPICGASHKFFEVA
jgi:rubrerythrin